MDEGDGRNENQRGDTKGPNARTNSGGKAERKEGYVRKRVPEGKSEERTKGRRRMRRAWMRQTQCVRKMMKRDNENIYK